MKKKVAFFFIFIFVMIAIVALIAFVFLYAPTDKMEITDLSGTWKIATQFSNGSPILPENDFVVFTEDCASVYRDGVVLGSSPYVFTSSNGLELPEMSRKYTIERRTDNYIRMYENSVRYIELIRYPNNDMSDIEIDTSKLYDEWNVTYRNTADPIENEILVFDEDTIKDYRNGTEEPVAISEYSWTCEDCLVANKWGIEFKLVQFSDKVIFFIETQSGLIWELQRKS